MFQLLRKWIWILMAAICFILLYLMPEQFIEKYYSNGLFILIRNLLDNTFGRLPFPSFYLFIIFLIIAVIKWFLHFFREKPQPLKQRIFKAVSFFCFLITLFFVMWGFNYGRIPLETKLKLSSAPLSFEQLNTETELTIKQLEALRKTLKKDTGSLPQIIFINNIETISRDALNKSLKQFSYAYSSKLRGRFIAEDLFLVFSVGGQYLPYVGEGNVDDGVFYSKKPFYLIHEMAHGNGFTNEAECNFLAYISCVQSGNVALEYSGELNYLLYLLAEIKYRDNEIYASLKNKMPRIILKDLEELKKHTEEHTFKTAFLGDAINNIYLKIMKVPDGIKNYDKMVLLVYAWKHKK